jgi:hypothetical protein
MKLTFRAAVAPAAVVVAVLAAFVPALRRAAHR